MVFASSGAKKLMAAQMDGSAKQIVVSMHVADQSAVSTGDGPGDHDVLGDKCHQVVAVLASPPMVKDRWAKSQPMSVDIDRLTGIALKLLKRPPRHIS
ncbi:hypothetical protein R2A130_3075 [Ahrensia sp. R2A130]|nr:hypothetical protein R2A130_3075 [Ahrensia sp. R2A130]